MFAKIRDIIESFFKLFFILHANKYKDMLTLYLHIFIFVGSVVDWLKCRDCEQHGLDSKPPHAILLCPWGRHFTVLFPAWWSWQAVLNFSHISIKIKKRIKNFNRTVISWYLRKQVEVIACPMYILAPPSLSSESEG